MNEIIAQKPSNKNQLPAIIDAECARHFAPCAATCASDLNAQIDNLWLALQFGLGAHDICTRAGAC
jgi:hypothetical protein